jgi:hypothetical protein
MNSAQVTQFDFAKGIEAKPLGDWVIARRSPPPTTGHSGKVVAVGPGRMLENGALEPVGVQIDDVIVCDPRHTILLEMGDDTLIAARKSAIIYVS